MAFPNVVRLICLLTVLYLKPIKSSNSTKSCHSICVCLSSSTVDCSNRNLTSVPVDLPNNTTALLLDNNRIYNITPKLFDGLPQLTKVVLSGNKVNCYCSLAWVKNASINIRFIATCNNPPWVGRLLGDVSVRDMCTIPSTTVANTSMQSAAPTTMPPEPTTVTEITTPITPKTTKATTTEVRTTKARRTEATMAIAATKATTESTTTEAATTTRAKTTEQAVMTTEILTSTVYLQTTVSTPQMKPTKPPSPVIKTATPLPTHHTKVPSPVPTLQLNRTDPHNLTILVAMSDRRDLNAESMTNLVEMLENNVQRNYSDNMITKNFLLISSNLMDDKNRKTWSTVNESFSGVERLLKAVNKAMRLQAKEMLKPTTNETQHFFVNYSNLVAEIQVDLANSMKKIQFPSSRSPKDDYVQLNELAGVAVENKTKLAVIGMKSAQFGDLLPQRSLIDSLSGSNFTTGSGLLSASVVALNGDVSSSVQIRFKNKNVVSNIQERVKCVFWQYEKARKNGDTSSSSKSGWSDEGCEVVSQNRSTTICHCGHMTDFAVLSVPIIPVVVEDIVEPTVIMYIAGLCLLVGAIIALIRNVAVWHQTRRERLSVLIHECVAFVLTTIVFVLGLFLDYQQAMCMVFAALLHCFVLAVFCWILTEFIQLYLCVNFGWNRNTSRLKYFAILGWGVPVALVGITLAVTRQSEYGSTQWCWYSDSHIILLTYVCPIVLCVLVSMISIAKLVSLKSDATDDVERKDLSVILALSGFLIPLVLCAFTTAALSADQPEQKVFQYLFAVFCILLAIYIVGYHCWLDREIMKLSVRQNVQRARPKRDYYSTKETVMYSEDTSEGKNFSLIFPSRKSPTKKQGKSDKRSSAKRSDSASPFDYDSTVPMYPSVNDSSLKSFKSQVSTQQHTLDTPPNTLSAITISRPNSQCIELTSLSDLDRRPDGAEQTDSAEHSEFYGARHSMGLDKERQRTSGCSTDCTNATTFGKERVVQKPESAPNNSSEVKNRISGASSAGVSGTSRSSVSGASLTTATAASEVNVDDEAFETEPFIRTASNAGPEIRSDPPSKIPKRRKRGSRRRLDDEFHDDDADETKVTRQNSSTLPTTEGSVKLKQYTSF